MLTLSHQLRSVYRSYPMAKRQRSCEKDRGLEIRKSGSIGGRLYAAVCRLCCRVLLRVHGNGTVVRPLLPRLQLH